MNGGLKGLNAAGIHGLRDKSARRKVENFKHVSKAADTLLPVRVTFELTSDLTRVTWMGTDGGAVGDIQAPRVDCLVGLVDSLNFVELHMFFCALVDLLSDHQKSSLLKQLEYDARIRGPGALKADVMQEDGDEDRDDENDRDDEGELDDVEEDEESDDFEDDEEDEVTHSNNGRQTGRVVSPPVPPIEIFPISSNRSSKVKGVPNRAKIAAENPPANPSLPRNDQSNWSAAVSTVFDDAPDEVDKIVPIAKDPPKAVRKRRGSGLDKIR